MAKGGLITREEDRRNELFNTMSIQRKLDFLNDKYTALKAQLEGRTDSGVIIAILVHAGIADYVDMRELHQELGKLAQDLSKPVFIVNVIARPEETTTKIIEEVRKHSLYGGS